jgi:hypothetical protein
LKIGVEFKVAFVKVYSTDLYNNNGPTIQGTPFQKCVNVPGLSTLGGAKKAGGAASSRAGITGPGMMNRRRPVAAATGGKVSAVGRSITRPTARKQTRRKVGV